MIRVSFIIHPYLSYFQKLFNLLLYGNFFIAFCAVALLWQTELILYKSINCNYLTIFVFSSTLFLYALHRIVGIQKVQAFSNKYRYFIINQYRSHILLYAILGGALAAWFFFYLTATSQLFILLPAFLALGYVLPFFGKERRLRDFDYLKIFLVAIVWAFITVLLPLMEQDADLLSYTVFLLLLERMLFIFAITLPFDIRDLKVDESIKVKTIPAMIGILKTKRLAGLSLLLAFLISGLLYIRAVYSFPVLIALGISYSTTYLLVRRCDQTKHDYYFTAVMDGTMIIQFLLVYGLRLLL